jgi:hypothetical protein
VDLNLGELGFADGAVLVDRLGERTYTVAGGAVEIELDQLSGAILVLQ